MGMWRQAVRAAGLALATFACAGVALAAEPQLAPGGRVDPLGVSGAYACSVGDARRIEFQVVAFEDGTYRTEERADAGGPVGVRRYAWQFATATLFRERVTSSGAVKFRRLTGSLRMLQELLPGKRIGAEYAEAPLDGSGQPLEWRYEVVVGDSAVSFAPSGLGEVAIVQIEERRWRYVDGQGQPLPLGAAAQGFERRETARIAYAPDLGLALRIERRAGARVIEACSLDAYRRR